ncbi:MAG: type II secretion system major pseudopilin GspG [Phycisphaerales bacterium]
MHRCPNRPARSLSRRGFTLLELMLVLVILGVLATVASIAVVGQADNARKSTTVTSIRTIETALKSYNLQTGAYPTTQEGIGVLVGPFLEKPPLDGWKRPFEYFHPGQQGREYEIISRGKDGEYGTADDIRSWEIQ